MPAADVQPELLCRSDPSQPQGEHRTLHWRVTALSEPLSRIGSSDFSGNGLHHITNSSMEDAFNYISLQLQQVFKLKSGQLTL